MTLRLALLSSGRQDWGILRSVCLACRRHQEIALELLLGGMHESDAHGKTAALVEAEGFSVRAHLPWLAPGDAALQSAAAAVQQIGETLERLAPDALLLVGDRYETLAAALAATLTKTALVHLHGGEETRGAIDDAMRHAISKLSHLHFVSHAQHAARLYALGEAPNTVHVVGAPGLDNLSRADLPDRAALAALLGLPLEPPLVLVTFHPTTLAEDDLAAALAGMDAVPATYVMALPNVDPGAAALVPALRQAAQKPRRVLVPALGERNYWGLMKIADAMLGNSSSALIEAPALALPAVNVGARQQGRLRLGNVVDVDWSEQAIRRALLQAIDPTFRAGIAKAPLGDGRAGERIADILSTWRPPRPLQKAPIAVPA